jgi:hypothetical protein
MALFGRPLLTSSVKSIDTQGPDEYSLESRSVEGIHGKQTESLREAVQSVPFDDKRSWLAGVEKVRRGFLASLLVAITPKLINLSTDASEEDVKRMVGWMRIESRAYRSPWSKPFTHLKRLELGFENTHMADIIPLLQLPTLEEFIATMCVGTYTANGRGRMVEVQPDSIYVKTLELALAHMDVEFLCILLSGCRNLQRLEYEVMDGVFVVGLAEEDRSRQFTVRELVSALETHTPGLEELSLAFLFGEEVDVWETNALRGVGQLKRLRKLCADMTTMTDLQDLPSQLQEIEVRRCSFDEFEGDGGVGLFKQLIKGKEEGTHALQRVKVTVDDEFDLYMFFGLHKEIDRQEVLLAAVYWQRERFYRAGLQLEFMTQDVNGMEDTKLNELLEKSLELVDMEALIDILRFSGKEWDGWGV